MTTEKTNRKAPVTKEGFIEALELVSRPVGEPVACSHCWHQWGSASGGIGSDGSCYARGQNRCCHCGEIESYDFTNVPHPPVQHGQFLGEIERWPR